jgi:hypothetical protein
MSIKFHSKELSHAEASFLKWQYGFDEEDEPFERALWQAIMRAWDADSASNANRRHLDRLGCPDAYPEEVALYVKFRSGGSDKVWNELIRRARSTPQWIAAGEAAPGPETAPLPYGPRHVLGSIRCSLLFFLPPNEFVASSRAPIACSLCCRGEKGGVMRNERHGFSQCDCGRPRCVEGRAGNARMQMKQKAPKQPAPKARVTRRVTGVLLWAGGVVRGRLLRVCVGARQSALML